MKVEVPGFPKYSVSDDGSVYGQNGQKLSLQENKFGYLTCVLYRNNKQKRMPVHRLVATVYINNPLELAQVNHKDGNKKEQSRYQLRMV